MTGQLISHEQLKAATGCKTRESLERTLRDQHVPFLYGAGGTIFTTLEAVNAAMGLNPHQAVIKDIDFRR
jgi:hypothetical protein